MKAYLEKLIKVLNDEDIQKIESIALKKSKLKIFIQYLIQLRTGNEMTKAELMTYLNVDDKMLRKMKSVLLRKCYHILAPDNNLELLDLLSKYRLVDNFKREMKLQELKLNAKTEKNIKVNFYENVVKNLLRLPYSTLDLVELEHYSKLYIKYANRDDQEKQSLIHSGRILIIRMVLVYYKREKKMESKTLFLKSIQQLEAGALKFKDNTLMATTFFCKALYHYWVEANLDAAKKLFDQIINKPDLLRLLPNDFSNAINGFYGEILFQLNEFEQAILKFETYAETRNPYFYYQPNLLSQLAELYMITNRMADAKKILDNDLNRFLESGESEAVQITSITYTKYFLINNELTEAFKQLQTATRNLNKKFYLIYDVEIRTLELVYFILSGEIKFAKSILARTLKFLREKAKTKLLKSQIEKQEILSKMCKAKAKNKDIKIFVQPIQKVFNGYSTINSILLTRYCITS